MHRKKLEKILLNGIARVQNSENVNLVVNDIISAIFSKKRKKHKDNFIEHIGKIPMRYLKIFYHFFLGEFFRYWRRFRKNEVSYDQLLKISMKVCGNLFAGFLVITTLIEFSLESFSPIISIVTFIIFIGFTLQQNIKN